MTNQLKCFLIALAFVLSGTALGQSKLPACPEYGYFHNCFGTRTYAAKPDSVSKASEAFKELDREIEKAKKHPSGEEQAKQVVPVAPQITTYVGEFKDDVRDGNGVFTEYGMKYEGNWKNDKKHGKGLLLLGDGHFVFLAISRTIKDLVMGSFCSATAIFILVNLMMELQEKLEYLFLTILLLNGKIRE